MRLAVVLAVAAVVAMTGCFGGSDGESSPPTRESTLTQTKSRLHGEAGYCGEHDFGEIVRVEFVRCERSIAVAGAYFEGRDPPKPWYCTRLPGKRSDIVQCVTQKPYSEAGQYELASYFEVRPLEP